jgi:hypothetical protein
VARNQLNLLQDGFTGDTSSTKSDAVVHQQSGYVFYYIVPPSSQTLGWGGSLTALDPGRAYWIRNRHAGHTWIYTYKANGQALTMPEGGGDAVRQPTARTTVIERTAPPAQRVPSGTVINRK